MKSDTLNRVTLEEVPRSQSNVIENLMQLYQHDLSEFAAGSTEYGEVGSEGRFAYHRLDSYWREEGRIPYVIRAGNRLVGFALVNQWSALGRLLDEAVAEFFILRKYRRTGIGSRAAKIMFESCRGRWEIPVAAYNQPALSFWRHTVSTTVEQSVEEHPGDGDRWSGTVLCFDCRFPLRFDPGFPLRTDPA
jgi:predicted acetyltransferase